MKWKYLKHFNYKWLLMRSKHSADMTYSMRPLTHTWSLLYSCQSSLGQKTPCDSSSWLDLSRAHSWPWRGERECRSSFWTFFLFSEQRWKTNSGWRVISGCFWSRTEFNHRGKNLPTDVMQQLNWKYVGHHVCDTNHTDIINLNDSHTSQWRHSKMQMSEFNFNKAECHIHLCGWVMCSEIKIYFASH